MAPMKRHRGLLDGGEEEGLEEEEEEDEENTGVGSERSSLRKDNRKKARLSQNSQEESGSEDITDEEFEKIRATQFDAEQREKQQKENEPAENGIIESITCTNFMCHPYLEVTLGPLINFIIGHNGSGKSAVLTALTLCLGGKASATNRGGNLKSFIKEGQESSTLAVKLKNKGGSAYQPEVYGDSIIVERHFSKAGTSGFKLKSSSGRLISNRKGDLEEICDYFALQLDNPMSVLTQDMARQFLNNSSPHEKYKFFVKGTQLEQLDQDYNLIEENLDKLENGFSDLRNDIENLAQNAQKAQELLNMSEKQDTLRHKVRRLGQQMAWVQVEEQERNLESYNNDLRKADDTLSAAERKVADTTDAFEKIHNSYEQANQAVREVRNEAKPLKEEKDQAKQEFDKVKDEAKEVHAEQRRIREYLYASERSIKNANHDIEEEHRRLEKANGGSHTRRLADLDVRKSNVCKENEQLEEHISGLPILKDKKKRADEDLEKMKDLGKSKRDEVDECELRMRNLMRDRGQQQRGYPPNMSQLMNAIRQDEGFQQIPVGPIGDYLRLLKPVWSSILERTFGGMLNSFIVTSKQDQTRLSGIMQRVRCSSPILIGNNHLFDFTSKEPDEEFATILRVLEIESDLVVRQLIISQGIEQAILIEDRKEATDRMDAARLRNVKQCFSINPAKVGAGVRTTYGWGGTLSSTYVEPYQGLSRMRTDDELQIRYQQDTLQRLKNEYRDLEQQQQELQRAVETCKRAIANHDKKSFDLRIVVQRAETEVEELQDALDKDAVEEGRLDALKEGLKDLNDEKAVQESSYEESVNAKDRLSETMKKFTEQMRAMDDRIAEAEVKIRKAEGKANRLSEQRDAALQEKNAAIQLLADAKEDRRELESAQEDVMARVADFKERASRVSSRIPIPEGETGVTLEKRLERAIADLKASEDQLGGNKQKITEDCAKAKLIHKNASDQFQSEERLSQLLKKTLFNRRRRWKIFQRSITARARIQFNWLLSERGFRGRLTVAHRQRLLDLDVQPDQTQDGKGRKTKTLSGGEKSFSTICLLLSLWEAMGTPIRCLDEFDVFMDTVNREVSMGMMIVAAKRSAGRQFILITPQSMSKVNADGDVKIIKMSDPERGQTTISFPGA